jgi:uncharacterized protein YeaO (DUF488 family)
MTVYTDSLSHIKRYENDYYKIAVTVTLSYNLQSKIDAWFHEVSPSRYLSDMLEQKKILWDEFVILYHKEMSTFQAKSKIKWIKDYSKHNDIVLLCYENESDPKCHRHLLKKLIEEDNGSLV